ncbi:helix-turn-helix transcriptional regulator [Olivibacter sp. SDN3]|uniref:AraC family transcriptional regulator n=1 Tax=Olivibacter sp. SDN3 TaxID=2764720 RepID=UPI00165184A2|nr:AraC family transcriptional regulator [Olivibacter sp. SDN3]QNL48181.1 helix-turn-helix transcriptional regulator [Olivibacter sp. SDN3]
MKKKHLYQPFELHVSDMEHWNERPLKYQFFEIVQIIEGEGTRIVNENKFSYSKGSIFLFTPLDCRGFESCVRTRFCSIRFSNVFLEQYKSKQERERVIQWLQQLENIFTHHNRFEQLLIKYESDCKIISSLINNMIEEYNNKKSYYDENLQHLVTLVLNIISRNVLRREITLSNTRTEEPLINKILVYLHQHIYYPEKLRIKYLAEHFNLSSNYMGEYFKKLTGESLHCYITQYKMNIIEQRLTYSEYSIGQIVDELGFSDESHLSRQFKKHSGMTPADFRRNKVKANN